MKKYVEGCDAGEKDQAVLLAEIQLLREKTEVSDMRWLDRDTRAAAVQQHVAFVFHTDHNVHT